MLDSTQDARCGYFPYKSDVSRPLRACVAVLLAKLTT